jgi:cytochrome c553
MSSRKQTAAAQIVTLAVLMSAGVALAQDAGPGNAAQCAMKVQMCQGCHGIEGWRTAYPEVYKVPRIAGQHEAYIVKALQEYKAGERSHPSMRAIAASLSDQDMADVAAYYGQTGLANKVK